MHETRIVHVSFRQYQVLRQLATDGPDDETIGRRLGITAETVRSHMKIAYRKLGVSNRTAAALMVARDDVILKPGGQGSKEPHPLVRLKPVA